MRGRSRTPARRRAWPWVSCRRTLSSCRATSFDFLLFCQRNPKPCPVLDVTEPGGFEPKHVAPGADLRTDVPRYRVYRKGELTDEPVHVRDLWRDDLVGFLTGCSFTFENAL